MLINELALIVALQEQAKVIVPRDVPLQFDSVDEKYGCWRFGFSQSVQERILQIGNFCVRHGRGAFQFFSCYSGHATPKLG